MAIDNIYYVNTASINVLTATGSLSGTASYAGTASILLGSVSQAINSTQSLNATNSLLSVSSSYALSASNALSSAYSPCSPSASYSQTASLLLTQAAVSNYFPFWINNTLSTSSLIQTTGSQVVIGGSPDITDPEVLVVNGISGQTNVASFYNSINNFSQIKIENDSGGTTASADLVAQSNSGSDTFGYVDLGINCTQYSQSTFGNTGPLDSYLYAIGSGSVGGNLTIGVLGSSKSIVLHTAGASTTNERLRITDTSISTSVPITSSLINVGIVSLITSSVPAYSEGTMFYDSASATLAYYNDNNQMTVNVGQEQIIKVFNSSSNSYANGSPVYISSSFGNIPNAWLALADGTNTKANVAGITTTTISSFGYGYITAAGRVNGLNLNLATGSALWLSSTQSGSFQTTIPIGTSEKVLIGTMLASGSNTGTVLVSMNEQAYGSTTASYAATSSWASAILTASFSINSGNSVNSTNATVATTAGSATSASYATGSYNGALAYAAFGVIGTTITPYITRNLTITRLSAGLYGFKFTTPAVQYGVLFTGNSGSIGTPATNVTASIGAVVSQLTQSFSMSIAASTSPLIRADCVSGSVIVYGF